jgi:hypothetical protein
VESDESTQRRSRHRRTTLSGISAGLAVLLRHSLRVAVANIYYAQPLLGQIGRDLGVGAADLGLVTIVILIVPLGDLMNRRLLIVSGCVIAAAALHCCRSLTRLSDISRQRRSSGIGHATGDHRLCGCVEWP